MITNALIRIEGKKGAAPFPFEQPNQNLNFWVLELAVPEKEEKAQLRWLTAALKRRRELITKSITRRGGAVLFLQLSSRGSKPTVFEPAFIQAVSNIGLGLEVYEEEVLLTTPS